jgi:hypothetical protein
MPAGALAAARAVAVLGTAATVGRTRRLADLDGDTCAEAIGALMAERLVEDESLRFVHALVRSAVYQDLAVPVRQRWHQRAARMLDAEGAPQEVRSGCCAEPCPSAQAAPGRGPCRTVLRMPLTDGRCGSPARRAVGPGEAPVADQGHGHAGVLGHHVERAADSSLQLQPQGGWHFG